MSSPDVDVHLGPPPTEVGSIPAVRAWAERTAFAPLQIDCVTAIMLKIIDGKCKMPEDEKRIMAEVYDIVRGREGRLLGPEVHALIAGARHEPDDSRLARVYEQRLFAESMITRPVMKAFKAMLRSEGIIGRTGAGGAAEEEGA